jgi:hypothetical protein
LCKRRRNEGGDDAAALSARMGQHIAQKVQPRCQALSTLATPTLMASWASEIDELDAAQTASGELAQERGPERPASEGSISVPRPQSLTLKTSAKRQYLCNEFTNLFAELDILNLSSF